MKKQITLRKLEMRSIGDRMRYMIQMQGMSPCAFARSIGITRSALYQILSGRYSPSAQTLVDIADGLGCSVNFLLGIDSPEDDPAEGFATALLNIYAFRQDWTRAQRLCLSGVALDRLTPEQDAKLRRKYAIPSVE